MTKLPLHQTRCFGFDQGGECEMRQQCKRWLYRYDDSDENPPQRVDKLCDEQRRLFIPAATTSRRNKWLK